MSCNITGERLRAHVLKLDDREGADEMAAHIQSCERCKKEVAGMLHTAEVLVQSFNEEPPDWLMEKTLARIRGRTVRWFSWRAWGIPVVSGVTVLLLCLLFYPGLRHDARPGTSAAGSSPGVVNEQDGKHEKGEQSSLFDIVSDEMGIDMADPVDDRSIYESLGIAPEVAALLL